MRAGKLIFLIIILLLNFSSTAQYIRNGSATQDNCHCYTLTPAATFQSGSVWNGTKINLQQSFDFWFTIYLGCLDGDGADGMVFMLQPISTSVGSSGEGMGFGGVSPSVGIALDTYKNTNLGDPDADHISIQINGNLHHSGDLFGPVPILDTSSNAEDCKWHRLRIAWDANTKWLRAYVDNVLRVEKQVDLVPQVFNNDPMVFWGFSAATGGSVNVQKFCTALTPSFTTNIPGDAICAGGSIQFTDASESFAPIARYHWDFGDGSTSSLKNPPLHTYTNPGKYTVKLLIQGLDGCVSDTLYRTVSVGSVPAAAFTVADACYPNDPVLSLQSVNAGVSYQWLLNGTVISTDSIPDIPTNVSTTYTLELKVHSLYGCGPDAIASRSFSIHKPSVIDMHVVDGCVDSVVQFYAEQMDNATQVVQWRWSLGDGSNDTNMIARHTYLQDGSFTVRAWGINTSGCSSDTLERIVRIARPFAFAGRDTMILPNTPTLLRASGSGRYLWQPSVGLNNDSILNPTTTLRDDQLYVLRVTSPGGCVAYDTVLIKVFKGSTVYVPDAFTPNADGLNDRFRPIMNGINVLEQFTVFNRWGEMVYTTTHKNGYWDGKLRGADAPNGQYVWLLRAKDFAGKSYALKGTVLLMR